MAYTTAQALLEEFWDCRLPVDPAYFAERLGLTVKYSYDLGLKSGYLDVETKEICVNATECQERQRGVSGFLCLGRLFQGQPNEAALCI